MADNIEDRQIHTEKIYNTPVELVFEAWTRAEHLDNWWGPNGFTTKTEEINFRQGGHWIYQMHHDEYGSFPNFIRYIEIVQNKKISYEHGEYKDKPYLFKGLVVFEDLGESRTRLVLSIEFPTKEACEQTKRQPGAESGGRETLEKLDKYVTSSWR